MRQIGAVRVNFEACVRLFILLGFALFFYLTVQSGKAQYYVHPRIVPYMKFGIGAMLLLSLFTARDIFRSRRKKARLLPYLLFVVPLISAFVFPARVIDATSISGGNFRTSQLVQNMEGSGQDAGTAYDGENEPDNNNAIAGPDETDTSDEAADETFEENASDTGTTAAPDEIGASGGAAADEASDADALDGAAQESKETAGDAGQDSSGAAATSGDDAAAAAEAAAYGEDTSDTVLKLKGGTVVVGNNNFVMWNDEIYTNMEKYKGKKIEITGKVFKDKDLKENGFGIVRMMMSCCAADLQPVGLICRYDKAGELQSDAWIKVTGTIDTEVYEGEEAPIIKVISTQSAEKPEDEYVYP